MSKILRKGSFIIILASKYGGQAPAISLHTQKKIILLLEKLAKKSLPSHRLDFIKTKNSVYST